jgi:large subunit ribosomal protein L23
MRDIYSIIDTVRMSEKASILQENDNTYTFKVDKSANKIEIKKAVEKFFKVKVLDVRTINYAGKAKRRRRADAGRTASWKKAIVRLQDGDNLDLL